MDRCSPPESSLCSQGGKKGRLDLDERLCSPGDPDDFPTGPVFVHRCIASRNKKAAIQFLPLYLVTGDTQSIGTDNHNRYTASHGLQAAPEKMQA